MKVKLGMFRTAVLVYVILVGIVLVGGFALRARACECDPLTCNGCQTCEAGVCVDIDINDVTVDANYVCVGGNVTFTVITEPTGHEDLVEWSAPDGDPSVGYGETFTTSWDTAGNYTATAYYCYNSDSNDVNVVEVDLDISDVDETDEDNPGGYVNENDDDDDDDGNLDKSETGTVTGEDNLVAISLSVSPSSLDEGEVKLEATAGSSKIKVWEDSEKGTEVSLPKTWDLSAEDVDETLYVEGINGSSSPRDVELKLSFSAEDTTCDDKVRFTVVEIEAYIDSSYSTVLEDWPQNGSLPRSPKYLFTLFDIIYIQTKNLGIDTGTAETFDEAVKVTSGSDSLFVPVKETGINTQIFNNSQDSDHNLYLSTSTSVFGLYLKVTNEEVITFWLEIQPDSGDYRSCRTVKVDRAEVGVEWQSDYGTYDTSSTLNCADDFAEGFYDNLGSADESPPFDDEQVWFRNFNNGDLDSKESHWDSGGDSDYADSVDIALWCGHGPMDPSPYMRFFVDKIGGEKQPPDKLYWSEIDWGDEDMDWAVLNTCNFLNGTDTQLKAMASGVHLICGWATDMTIYCAAGEYFGDRLAYSGKTIKQAWFDQAKEYQDEDDENTARVFGATDCMGDLLGFTGPIQISRDPTSSSAYTHADYDCFP
jgi:hypothetical protein